LVVLSEGREHPGRAFALELRVQHKDGSWRWLESTGRSMLDDPAIEGVVINSRDITERKRAEEKLSAYAEELRALSLTDPLTGLSNRRGFFVLAEHKRRLAQRAGRFLTLLFVDIDGMKEINDRLGHTAGDQALNDAAEILRDTFRDSDVIARMGGDEFAVLAWTDGGNSAEAMVARLRENVGTHDEKTEAPFALSISAGALEFDPAIAAPLDELLDRADARMYADKRGRSGVR
jgi:diguanylate cyclase (GGDEF)-like protein